MSRFIRLYQCVFAFLLGLSVMSAQAFADDIATYAQLSSSTSQVPERQLTPSLVSFEHVDGAAGFKSITSTKVVVKNNGTYFITATGRVGISSIPAPGYLDLWLIKNGTPIPNTAVRSSIDKLNTAATLSCQVAIQLKAGDSISIGYFSSKPSIGLIANEATSTEPSMPSVVFTIYKI